MRVAKPLCFGARADDAQVSRRWRRAERSEEPGRASRNVLKNLHDRRIIQTCCNKTAAFPLTGAPVAVGMNIDIASIDMVSEVNMVGASDLWLAGLSPCFNAASGWHGWNTLRSGLYLSRVGVCVCVCMRVMHESQERI